MQISPCHCVGNFLWLSTHFKLTLPCFQVSLKSRLAHLGDLTSRRHTSSGSVLLNLARGYFIIGGFLFLRLFFGASAVSHLASLSSHRDPQGWRLHPLLCQQNLTSESHSLAIHLLLFQAFSSTPSTFIFLSANSQVEDTAGLFVNLIFK